MIKSIKIFIVIIIGICFIHQEDFFLRLHARSGIINNLEQTKVIEQDTSIGKIVIKKIHLEQPLFKINSEFNHVDLNVMVLNSSDYPDKLLHQVFLAAHSGTSDIAYFKHLDQLKFNDIVEIYYQGTKYQYQIKDVYSIDKTGMMYIDKREYAELILITCDKINDNLQIVYRAKLFEKIADKG